MTPDEQCARILGRQYLTHVQPTFGDAIPVRLEYGSDATLLGEMLRWFDDNGYSWLLSNPDDTVTDCEHCEIEAWKRDKSWVTLVQRGTINEAVRDALIQASEVQDES